MADFRPDASQTATPTRTPIADRPGEAATALLGEALGEALVGVAIPLELPLAGFGLVGVGAT